MKENKLEKMGEKRKNKRYTCFVPVDGKEGGLFDRTKTVDISREGIGFISSQVIPLHKEIAIELDLGEEDEPVFVIGKVKWVNPLSRSSHFRVGIFFENILRGSKSRLNRYFRSPIGVKICS